MGIFVLEGGDVLYQDISELWFCMVYVNVQYLPGQIMIINLIYRVFAQSPHGHS